MKSKHLLLTLLMALLVPWAANAQTTVTIGEGTATCNTNPIGTYYNYSITEQLYTAEEIGTAGTISSISFYYMGIAAKDLPITVYMKHVDEANLASAGITLADADEVFSGTLPVTTTAGWVTIDLATPFAYDGSSNLLIGFIKDYLYYFSGQSWQGTATTSCMARYTQTDYNAYTTSTVPSTEQVNRPNIQIVIEPAQSGGDVCEKPATLVAEDVTGNSATLTWTGGSGTYNVELKGGAYSDWTEVLSNTNLTTTQLTLQATTSYQARVQSVCDGTTPTSGWKSVSFTTPCASYDIPYTYGFEDAAPFACWTVISGNITRYNGTPNTGSYRLDFRGTTSNMIALPQFNEATNNLRVEFWTRPETSGGSSGKFAIGYMTDITDASTFVAVETYNSTEMTTTYVKKTVDFVNVPADANIAMRQFDCSTNYYWYVDDVTVKAIPNCIAPTDLAANATTTSAELSWTANSGETAWTLYYKKTTDENYTEVANVTANPYTLNGLTAGTNYQYYVVANCSADEASEPSEPFTFATACDAITTFPWSEDFESYASGDFSHPCWVNEHIEGDGTYIFRVSTSTMGTNSTHQLHLPDMAIGTLTKLVLPEMTLNGNYQFVLDVYRSTSTYNSSYPEEGIRVFASSDGEIEGATEITFIPRHYQVSSGLIPAEENAGWYTYELPIPMTGTCYIILRGESQYCATTYMDNFMVELAPTCMKPTNFVAANVTNHSATLGWTAGNEGQNAWQIAYSTTSFNPNDAGIVLDSIATVIDVEENTYTFDKTLDANTHYYMYVRGYCGDEDYSKWVGTNFTTGTANPSPTITAVDEITPVSAVLRWTAAGGDYLESYDIYYSQTSGEPANDSLIQYTGVDAGFTSKILENLTEGYWYVYMRAYHGETDGYSSWTPYYGYGFQVPEACPEPTGLAASDPTPNSITLTWTEGAEWQYAWKVAYSTDPEFNPADTTSTYSIVEVFGQQGPEITCTVTGLDSETTYYFKVLGNCNSPYGDSDWTDAVSETTLVNCPVPTDLNVTVAHTSATLNWTGYSDSYTVQYRTAGGYDVELVEGFESGSMPAGWTIEGDNQVSTKTWQVGVGDYSTATGTHSGDYNALIKHNSDGNETYLITPALDFSVVSEASLNLWYINRSWGGDTDEFGVYYRVNGGEWNELFSTTEAHSTWTELNLTLTGLAANTQIGFKCYDGYGYGIGLDDITILGGEYNEPGEWIAIENVEEETITIEGLEFGTKYDAQVKANCGEEYCDYITFTTNALKRFTTEGAWEVAANWTPAGAPTIDDVVSIEAPATISQIAYANEITVANGGSITIADGGQLVANSDVTNVTVEKDIVGYTVDNYETNNGYYFIANPTTASVNPEEAGLFEGTNYDLYDWAPSYQHAEWRNYLDDNFNLVANNTPAYLYANIDTVTLAFTGTVRGSQNRVSTTVYVSNTVLGAWNLIGNPLVCNAYLVANDGYALPYYKMNADGNGYEATTGEAIAPATGIFYEAPAYGQVYFTREAPFIIRNGVLNMNLRSNNKQLDNAIVSFGEGQQMSKFSFRENSTKVYIPMDGIDYAVVNAGQAGEMPVSFKAESNGSYSLNFTSQEVSFSYLHLIDNMTGDDVNLLETPYYSFNAQTTDYANRFRLVFATGSSTDGDSFGFINGMGNLCIFGIEGEATVQVVDVLGHVLSSETFSGSYERKLNVAPGVYMVRLIQGNDVKVQKIVVR